MHNKQIVLSSALLGGEATAEFLNKELSLVMTDERNFEYPVPVKSL